MSLFFLTTIFNDHLNFLVFPVYIFISYIKTNNKSNKRQRKKKKTNLSFFSFPCKISSLPKESNINISLLTQFHFYGGGYSEAYPYLGD